MIPWRRAWQPTPSVLAWRILWTEEPGGLQSIRSQSRTQLSTHARTHARPKVQRCFPQNPEKTSEACLPLSGVSSVKVSLLGTSLVILPLRTPCLGPGPSLWSTPEKTAPGAQRLDSCYSLWQKMGSGAGVERILLSLTQDGSRRWVLPCQGPPGFGFLNWPQLSLLRGSSWRLERGLRRVGWWRQEAVSTRYLSASSFSGSHLLSDSAAPVPSSS